MRRLPYLRVLLGSIAATGAIAGPVQADSFRVRAGGDHDWSPSAGSVDTTSPSALLAEGRLSDPRGSAPFALAAGPGVVRGALTGQFTNPAFLTLRFNPTTVASAQQDLTIVGPAAFVTTSLNLHVDGFVEHACGSMRVCDTAVQVTVRMGTRNHVTAVGVRTGVTANQLGLSVTPSPNGFRLHGEVTTPPLTVATNRPIPVLLRLDLKSQHLGDGSISTSAWNHAFENSVSYSRIRPVLNLPPGFDVTGAGVVGNRWRDPFETDRVPPVVSGFADRPPDANGWYRAPVTIDWRSVDPEPSSGAPTDPSDTVAAHEGQDVVYESEPSCDPAGNCATGTLVLSVDTTPPEVGCQAPAPVFLLRQPSAEVTAAVTDGLSGPEAPALAAAADTSFVGWGTASFVGRDMAGNETERLCPYRVEYGFEGFGTPVANAPASNDVRAGQSVPLSWRLTDATGTPVADLPAVQLTAVTLACDLGTTADRPTEQSAGGSGLQYLGDGRYQINWKAPREYARSCKTLRVDLGEGAHRTADFRLR